MEEVQPECEILSVYRKNQQNWLKVIFYKLKEIKNIPAQDLLIEYRNVLNFFSKKDTVSITMLAQNQAIPIIETYIEPKAYNLFMILVILQSSILIASNLMSSKVMHVFGVDIVAGALCFPLVYSISDIIVELYGFKASRKAMLLSILANSIIVFLTYLASSMPPAETWHHQEAYALVFRYSSRIFFSSMIAFTCGYLINSYLLTRFKEKIFHNQLFLRVVFACLIGLFIDSFIFVTLAHIGTLPFYSIMNMLLNVLFHKFIYEIFTAVILVYVIKILKKRYPDLNYQPLTIRFF